MDEEIGMNDSMYISYNQFLVYDASVDCPGCNWEEVHVRQGFARREGVVNFHALVEHGDAEVRVSVGKPPMDFPHERVVAVPFTVRTGRVNIEGPEEDPDHRQMRLTVGNYRLWCAQHVISDEFEQVQLIFEKVERPLERSAVIAADAELSPPDELVETSEVAEV